MSTVDTLMSALGAGGGFGGLAAIVKSILEKGELQRKLVQIETVLLPAFEKRVAVALEKLPELEQRADAAVRRLERALQTSRVGRNSGDHTSVATLMRQVEEMKQAVDGLRLTSPGMLQRLGALEERFERFETAYHEDYAVLMKELAGLTGEFRAEIRRRHGRQVDGE